MIRKTSRHHRGSRRAPRWGNFSYSAQFLTGTEKSHNIRQSLHPTYWDIRFPQSIWSHQTQNLRNAKRIFSLDQELINRLNSLIDWLIGGEKIQNQIYTVSKKNWEKFSRRPFRKQIWKELEEGRKNSVGKKINTRAQLNSSGIRKPYTVTVAISSGCNLGHSYWSAQCLKLQPGKTAATTVYPRTSRWPYPSAWWGLHSFVVFNHEMCNFAGL